MEFLLSLADLAGYVALLLWGTHLVSDGVRAGYGDIMRRRLGIMLRNGMGAFFAGLGVTLALQSSTATSLMGASFVSASLVPLDAGLTMMLGANVGTALVARLLSFPIAQWAPLGVLVGFILARRHAYGRLRHLGKVIMGLGFMLLALYLLVSSLTKWTSNPAVEHVLSTLGQQPVLLGVAVLLLTWACHSSVATVLLASTLMHSHQWPVQAVLAVLVAANVGSAISPAVETYGPEAKRLPVGNLVVRILGALVLILTLPLWERLPASWLTSPMLLVDAHVAFNIALAALAWPLAAPLSRLLVARFPSLPPESDEGCPRFLDTAAATSTPSVAVSMAARETLRMAERVETLVMGAVDILRDPDDAMAAKWLHRERDMSRLALEIRRFLSSLPPAAPVDAARRQEILRFSYDLEQIADLAANGLVRPAMEEKATRAAFSEQEWVVIKDICTTLRSGFSLAVAVFMNHDQEAARRLVHQKTDLRVHESQIIGDRMEAMRGGDMVASSPRDAMVSALRDLKRMHSFLIGIAYQVLEDAGQLQSRLTGDAVSTPDRPSDAPADIQGPPPQPASD